MPDTKIATQSSQAGLFWPAETEQQGVGKNVSPIDNAPRAPETLPEEQTRQGSSDYDPMKHWRAEALKGLWTVGLFSGFVNILMLTLPIYLFQLSDRVLTSRSAETLLMLSMLAFGLIAVLSLLDILRRQVLGRLSVKMETILGGPILASLVSAAPTGEGGNTAPLRALHQVRSFIASPTMLLLFDAPLSPLYFAVIFMIHPDLGFIAVTAGLILMLTAYVNQRATARPLAEGGGHASAAGDHAESFAKNAQVINAMGMLNESIAHWGKEQADALKGHLGGQERNYFISGFSKFARLIVQIVILGWGAYLALNGELSGGTMIAGSIIAGRALQPLEGMIEGWRNLVHTRQSYDRVKAAMARFNAEPARMLLPRPSGRLTVERVLYIPPGQKEPVLNGMQFTIEPGQSLAIVGPSGSGKSTLARILVGCLFPTSGQVRLDGTELKHWDRRQFGEYTGYLPQEVELFPGTIRDNICRMRTEIPDSAVLDASKAARTHDMITHLRNSYETVLDRNGAPLSGGQKQRVALARAFFGDPALVVLDEPNSNLDAVGEQALAETMRHAKERGVTIIVITQRPALLSIVDRVLILRAGRMEAFGPPAEVLRRAVGSAPAAAQAAPAKSIEGAKVAAG